MRVKRRSRRADAAFDYWRSASASTRHPDAFVILNMTGQEKPARISVSGVKAQRFAAWRTSQTEQYQSLGSFTLAGGSLSYSLPRDL